MSTAYTHEDLDTWQLAEELKDKVFRFTARPNVKRDRDFCDDIQRSARSAPANIAEGFYRIRPRDHARFLRNALASLGETKNHLGHARKQKYIDDTEFKELWRLASRAMGAAKSLHQYLMTCPPDGPVNLNLKPRPKNGKRPPDQPSARHVDPNPNPEPEP
jgi:four helix bundle protein